MKQLRVLAAIVFLSGVVACDRQAEVQGPDVPDGLRVTVEVDGREVAPITGAGLQSVDATYRDADHRAWRLSAILSDRAVQPHMHLDVEDQNGRRTIFGPLEEGGKETVLMVNRKGQVLIALVEPGNPFPAFHGRGGNRGRGGRANRIRGVRTLRLTSS